MPSLLSGAEWNDFYSIMKDMWDTFGNKVITWKRLKSNLDRYGEDSDDNGYVDTPLRVMNNYNDPRTWPITTKTESGGLDEQSIQLFILKQYLEENGWLTPEGYFKYNANDDLFIIDGLEHEPFGDTPTSQANSDDIWITLILKRSNTKTGETR